MQGITDQTDIVIGIEINTIWEYLDAGVIILQFMSWIALYAEVLGNCLAIGKSGCINAEATIGGLIEELSIFATLSV